MIGSLFCLASVWSGGAQRSTAALLSPLGSLFMLLPARLEAFGSILFLRQSLSGHTDADDIRDCWRCVHGQNDEEQIGVSMREEEQNPEQKAHTKLIVTLGDLSQSQIRSSASGSLCIAWERQPRTDISFARGASVVGVPLTHMLWLHEWVCGRRPCARLTPGEASPGTRRPNVGRSLSRQRKRGCRPDNNRGRSLRPAFAAIIEGRLADEKTR